MSEILPAVQTAVAEITAVVDERHTKYGSSNIANSPGGPLNGLRVRLHDKLARLNNYVDNGGTADFDDDNLRDCFIDVCGYALIGLLVLDGLWPGLEGNDPAAVLDDCPSTGRDHEFTDIDWSSSAEDAWPEGTTATLHVTDESLGDIRHWVRREDGWHWVDVNGEEFPTAGYRTIGSLANAFRAKTVRIKEPTTR